MQKPTGSYNEHLDSALRKRTHDEWRRLSAAGSLTRVMNSQFERRNVDSLSQKNNIRVIIDIKREKKKSRRGMDTLNWGRFTPKRKPKS